MLQWLPKILSFLDGFSMTSWLVTILLGALVMTFWRTRTNRGRRLPPGPYSLPLVGHLYNLKDTPHLYYETLRAKYGDLFGLFLGTRYTIVVSGPELIKEISMRDEFTGKPPKVFQLSPKYQHIADQNGEEWKEQRRFLLKVFRNLGMGKAEGENAIHEQVAGFLDALKAEAKLDDPKGIEIRELLFPAVSNIIFTMIMNRTFQDDEHMIEMLKEFTKTTTEYLFAQMKAYFIPWMKPFSCLQGSYVRQAFQKTLQKFETIIETEVERHEKNYTGVENLDYIDFYIEQLREKTVHSSFKRSNMLGNAEMFLLAGTDTIRFLMEYYLLAIVTDQDIQEKMYQEVINVVGKEKLPTWEDRQKMPYFQAVLLEIQRHRTLLPINDPRMTLEDVKLAGYDIPKNSVVLMNFYSVHTDQKLWGDPERFRPERFLSEDGKSINKLEQYITTFSFGKRNCPGEKLANIHLFIYLAAILQAFKIVKPKEGFQHTTIQTFVLDLQNFRIGLEPRE